MTDRATMGAAASRNPVRTCVGCRQRAHDNDLLRVVVGANGTAVPDPRRCASGRGAWVHREPACVDLAIRRRAFGRALRTSAAIDPAPVREFVEGQVDAQQDVPLEQDTTSGTPQEMTSYGHSMKRQQ